MRFPNGEATSQRRASGLAFVDTLGPRQICTVLDAERLVAPGAGHFVAAAPGFVNRLHEFLVSAA
jgi:hypothetical protein